MFIRSKLRAVVLAGLLALVANSAGAVTVVNCQPCTQVSTTNDSCPKPTGLAVGQLLIALPTQTGNGTMSTPAGWTIPGGYTTGVCGISGSSHFVFAAWKQATSTEVSASSYTFTWTGGFGGGGAICAYDYVNFSGGGPFDPSNSIACNQVGAASTTVTWVSMTTTVDKSLAVYAAESASPASTVTGPAGTTQRLSYAPGVFDNFWVGDIIKSPAGTIASVNGSQTSSQSYNALIFGIQNGPAAGGAAPLWPFP